MDQTNSGMGGSLDKAQAQLREVFTPSQPKADSRFYAGRDDLLATLIDAVEERRQHIVLYGERGIGKTSTLHVVAEAAREARYIVIYLSCGAATTFDEAFRSAAGQIPLLYHRDYAPTAAEAERGSSFADILGEDALTPSRFGEVAAKLTGTRALIILDEYDRATSRAFRQNTAELIKNLSDRLSRVQLVLAGVAADLTDLIEHIPSIRRNIFSLKVPKMTFDEVRKLIGHAHETSDIRFDDDAAERVGDLAQGSPYLVNLICHHAAKVALEDARVRVRDDDVSDAATRCASELSARTPASILSALGKVERSALAPLLVDAARLALSGDGDLSSTELIAAGYDASAVEQSLSLLKETGLIKASRDSSRPQRYTFAVETLPALLWLSASKPA